MCWTIGHLPVQLRERQPFSIRAIVTARAG
jgi:hypothetical protein